MSSGSSSRSASALSLCQHVIGYTGLTHAAGHFVRPCWADLDYMLCPCLQVEGLLRMPPLAAVCCRISASHSPIQTAMLTHTLTGRIMPCMRGCASPEGLDGCCQSLPWQPNVHLAYRRCEELAASMHMLCRGPLEAAAKAPIWAAGSHHHSRRSEPGPGPAGHGPLQRHLQAVSGGAWAGAWASSSLGCKQDSPSPCCLQTMAEQALTSSARKPPHSLATKAEV